MEVGLVVPAIDADIDVESDVDMSADMHTTLDMYATAGAYNEIDAVVNYSNERRCTPNSRHH